MGIVKFKKIRVAIFLLAASATFLFSTSTFAAPGLPTIIEPKANAGQIVNLPAGHITIKWTVSGSVGYSYILDGVPNTIPDSIIDGITPYRTYELSEGHYYFHVAGVDSTGVKGSTKHFEFEVSPATLLTDDFGDVQSPNSLGGSTWTEDIDGQASRTNYCDTSYETGVLKLDYQITTTAGVWAGYWTQLSSYVAGQNVPRDLWAYKSLSFRIKGATSGQKVAIGFQGETANNVSKVNVDNFLPGGVTTDWQTVVIPLYKFTVSTDVTWQTWIKDWTKIDSLSITFEEVIGSKSGTVYIDDIELLTDSANVDNFNAGGSLTWTPPQLVDNEYYRNVCGLYAVEYSPDCAMDIRYDSSGMTANCLRIEYRASKQKKHYAFWEYNLSGIGTDVSNSNALSFYVKGENGAERFTVYLMDTAANKAGFDIREAVTIDTDWHKVNIPLAHFTNPRAGFGKAVNLTKITKLLIAFEWEDMSGVVYIDNIEFTDDKGKEQSTGAVQVSGQSLLVNGDTFEVRSVGYQPTPIGYYPYDPSDGSPWMDVYANTEYNQKMWERDLPLIKEMGFNTIRTWARVTSTAFLDACQKYGLYVIMGFDISPNPPPAILDSPIVRDGNEIKEIGVGYNIWARDSDPVVSEILIAQALKNRTDVINDFREYVEPFKDHPAVLMWAIGNEVNLTYGGGVWNQNGNISQVLVNDKARYVDPVTGIVTETIKEFYTLANELARVAYEIEGEDYHPALLPNGDMCYIGDDDAARAGDASLNYIDIWGANVYSGKGETFKEYLLGRNFFTTYGTKSTKPLLITEYGVDAFTTTGTETIKDPGTGKLIEVPTQGNENQGVQEVDTKKLWDEFANSGVCIGGSIMEYSDEWWKGGDPTKQDPAGAKSPQGQPDKWSNEEWYGIFEIAADGKAPAEWYEYPWNIAGDGLDEIKPRQSGDALGEKQAGEFLVDDFNSGRGKQRILEIIWPDEKKTEWVTGLNKLDGIMATSASTIESGYNKANSHCGAYYYNADLNNVLGKKGNSLMIDWDLDEMDPLSWGVFYALLGKSTCSADPNAPGGYSCALQNGFDSRPYDTLSFWVKGSEGGEMFAVGLRDIDVTDAQFQTRNINIPITDYLPQGVTREWQKVEIPLSVFTILAPTQNNPKLNSAIASWERLLCFSIAFYPALTITKAGDKCEGDIYIDDIKFESKSAPLEVANFNFDNEIKYDLTDIDPIKPLIGDAWWQYIAPAKPTDYVYINGKITDVNPYAGKYCYEITYNVEKDGYASWNTGLGNIDVSSYDTLSFYIKGSGTPYVSLADGFALEPGKPKVYENKKYVNIADYATVSGEWQMVNIPLSVFLSQGVNLTDVAELSFAWGWEDEAVEGTIYVDDIEFVRRSSTLIMPTLNRVPLLTNATSLKLSGTKTTGTAIYINGVKIYGYNEDELSATEWSYNVSLEKGSNTILIKARDSNNNDSKEIKAIVDSEPDKKLTAPAAAKIYIVNDPENKSRNDSVIRVTVAAYPPTGEKHTGYRVEMSKDGTFVESPKRNYAVVEHWHNYSPPEIATPIDGDETFDIDMNWFVEQGANYIWSTLPGKIYVRVRAAKYDFEPSGFNGTKEVVLSAASLLESPEKATLLAEPSNGTDVLIQVAIEPRTAAQRTSGKIKETGYRVDIIPKDKDFTTTDFDDMYHVFKYYDKNGDSVPDEVDVAQLTCDVDFRYADSRIFSWGQLTTNGIKVSVVSVRDGYMPSTAIDAGSIVVVTRVTRLANPVKDKISVTNKGHIITVTIQNYDPPNLGKVVPPESYRIEQNKRDTRHTGYRINIAKDGTFKDGETFYYYYIHDPDKNSVPDEIKPPGEVKLDIDLTGARSVFGNKFISENGEVYVNVLATRDGYALNYEDIVVQVRKVSFTGTGDLSSVADFDDDGDVDKADLQVFNFSWLKKSGEQGYNPKADLYPDGSPDGIVNFKDYAIFAKEWKPTAEFKASFMAGAVPLRVNFESDSIGEVKSWAWDFGDGETGYGKIITHEYNDPGIYSVTLKVEGPGGSDEKTLKDYIKVFSMIVQPGESIREAIDKTSEGQAILISNGTYNESITLSKSIALIGEGAYDTTIEGGITCLNADPLVENLTVASGIKATNSGINVENCILRGGIEIWTLSGSKDISPVIENNLILNTGIGVYLYAQANGGAISGSITNNTFDGNECGIFIRMRKANPAIQSNIFTNCGCAVYRTYGEGEVGSISGNCFFGNSNNVLGEELQKDDQLSSGSDDGNIAEDPEYKDTQGLDYYPENAACDDKGVQGVMRGE